MIISYDVDGVLANFYRAVCDRYDRPYTLIDTWHVDWIKECVDVWEDAEFWETLPVLNCPGQIRTPVDFYITSIPKKMKRAREKWLDKMGYPAAPVIVTDEKEIVCKRLNVDVHIDDKLDHVIALNQMGIRCIKYCPPYMSEEPTTYDVDCLTKVPNLI